MLREIVRTSSGVEPELGHRFTDSQINVLPFYYTSKCTNTGNKNNDTYFFRFTQGSQRALLIVYTVRKKKAQNFV